MKTFINGFRSWVETHHEIVSVIGLIRSKDTLPEKLQKIQDADGTPGFYDLCIELTDVFEEINKDRQWDGEFWEEIEQFIEKWLNR